MPILDVQVRMRELGRIRTGQQVPSGNGRKRPAKLETFRLTSVSKPLVEAAAEAYGGEVRPWDAPGGRQWEVITGADSLPIVIPPGESLSQWYELWSGGGCQRRCDGRTEYVTETPCGELATRLEGGKVIPGCPADPADRRDAAQAGEACKPTTRLGVLLPELPDLGIWRLESHGFYAAVELAGAARFLAIASASGLNIPARLRLDQREKKVPGRPTNKFAVPVIEFTTMRVTDLLAAGRDGGALALGDGATAVPALPEPAPAETPKPSSPEQARRLRADRPPLGEAPGVPDGSTFRRPAPNAAPAPGAPPAPPPPPEVAGGEPVDDEPADEFGGWGIADEPMGDEPATAPPLVDAIRQAAEASKAKGQMRDPARKAVFDKLVRPVGAATFKTVVMAAFGEDGFKAPSAAQAAGLTTVADSFESEEALVSAWRAAAAAIDSEEA